jgi:hypothetical protein
MERENINNLFNSITFVVFSLFGALTQKVKNKNKNTNGEAERLKQSHQLIHLSSKQGN